MGRLSTSRYYASKFTLFSARSFPHRCHQGSKIVGKQSLKLVPVLGWCWIFTESIFLRRVWESDRETLVNDLRKVLADYPENYFFNVNASGCGRVLFCHLSSVFTLLWRHTIHREEKAEQHEDCSRKRPSGTEAPSSSSNKRFYLVIARSRKSKWVHDRTRLRRKWHPFLSLRSLVAAVYDLTIGFKKTGALPTLLSILKGRACQAEIFIR